MKPEEYEIAIKEKFEPILNKLKKECIEKKYLIPKIVYGYYPCKKRGNSIIIYDNKDNSREILQFEFPRQKKSEFLCLSDYFNDKKDDIIAFHVVTIGDRVAKICQDLNEKGKYDKALYLHGLAVETAEGLAEYANRYIISELGFKKFQGLRYSFGYPACPDLKDQEKLFDLLDATNAIGTKLTESYQIDPECSTSAIIVYHKDAKYFNT